MKRNPDYEAGFTRADSGDLSPEEIAQKAATKARVHKFLVIGGMLLAVGIVGAGVFQLRRDTPAKQLARARTDLAAGNHASATIELKRSLQGNPLQPEARFLLGNEFWFAGDAKAAEIEYQKALQGGFPADTGLVPLARAQLAQGKFDQLIATVNNAAIDAPESNAELQTMLGTAYLAQGKGESGMAAFATAREIVPNFSGTLIAESRYLVSQEKYAEAAAMLASVPADDKRQAELQVLKGDIARALKKPQEAVVAYQKALELNPRSAEVGIHLAQIHIDLGEYDLAQKRIDVVAKNNPRNAQAQFIRALAAYLRHDLPMASDAIIQSVQLAPTDGRAQFLAGMVALQLGQLVDAEAPLRESIRLLPPGTEARKALVTLYMQRGELGHAEEFLQPMLGAADPETATLVVKLAVLRGDAAKASALFEQASARRAPDVNGSLIGAALLFSAGKPDAGLARLVAAAHAHPENPELDAALVMAQVQTHHNDAAFAAWQALDRKTPDSPRAYRLLAQIASARGDAAGVRKALDKAVALDPKYFPAISDLVALDLQAQQVDQARARLKALIAADPKSVDAPLLLARVEEANGAPVSTVIDLLKLARSRDPRSIQAISETVAFHDRHGDRDAALAAAQDGIAVDPNDQTMLLKVADLMQRSGPQERALPTLTRLAALNSENADYAVRLGMSQLAAGRSEDALISFRNAFKRAPQRTDIQAQTVAAFLAAGKTEEATRTLFEVSQAAPESPLIGELGADIRLAAKQFPEALAGYRQALATTPSTRLAIKNYQALMLAKQRGQATTLLVDWQAKHPNDAAMWLFDAQIGLDAKDYARAANDFRKVLDTTPDDPAILNNLAWTLQQQNDPKALAFAEKASRLAPQNADFADTLGDILLQQGQTKRALEMFTQATTLAPHKLDFRLRMAKAQIRGDQKDAARATLRSVVAEAPDSAEGKESSSLLSTL